MKMFYKDKEIEIIECKSFFSRLIGNMFKKEIKIALLFNKCNSIHTFFMRIIICDKNNKILYYYKNLGKRKIILPKKNVYKTIELPVNILDVEIGEFIKIKS